MKRTEALKLALEAYIKAGIGNSTDFVLQGKAYDLAVEALAQPEQEPDYWRNADGYTTPIRTVYSVEPLYTTPPTQQSCSQRQCNVKPLTDEQIRNLWAQHAAKQNGWSNDTTPPMIDIGNGPRFQADWHESEYQIFKAGFNAAHGIKE